MNTKQVVLDFFYENARSPLPEGDDNALMACCYLDTGVIDSLGIVMMLAHLEETLEITLTAEDVQSYEFQTVGGLLAIVEKRLAEKK